MGKKIGILGAGSWGITLAILLEKTGNTVTLWEPLQETYCLLCHKRENIIYFPGFKIPDSVLITQSIKQTSNNSEFLILVVRSVFFREAVRKLKPYYKGQPLCIATKGLEIKSGKRMSEILSEELGEKTAFGVLSGPTIAKEVALCKPSAAVIATTSRKLADTFQKMFDCKIFRIYTTRDITGVEIGGSFKNVLAIGAGIIDGMNLGINTKSSYLTRGLNEMINAGLVLGAKEKTFRGLSGIGDLITTSFSPDSRNRSFGEAIITIGKDEYLKNNRTVIEGIPATKAFYTLQKKNTITMPITESLYNIIYRNKSPFDEITKLMGRKLKEE